LEDSVQLFPATYGIWAYDLVGGDVRAAREMAQDLLNMADRAGDPILLYGAHTTLGACLYYLGELRQSQDHFERAVGLYDPRQRAAYRSLYRREPGVYTWGESCRLLWSLGHPDRALRRVHEMIALAQEVAEPEMRVYAECFAAHV